jgi:PP-loop superfamily ATP-utilizing enzyme
MFDVGKLAILDKKLKELTFKFVSIDVVGYKTGKLVVID